MNGLDFIKTYLGDSLMMTPDTLDKHLCKLTLVLKHGLKVKADKSAFCAKEIKYIGYCIAQDGI
eukprot:10803107-Ditylum_brightwellii.AAC.1